MPFGERLGTMGEDLRGTKPRPRMRLNRLIVTERTTELEIFEELLPVSIPDLLVIVNAQAGLSNDSM